jgi:hypothetical protein
MPSTTPPKIRWPDIAHADDYHGPQPGFAVYEAAYIANGQWTPEKAGDEAWRQVVRAYFAAISHVDHEIGRFLDALDASPFGADTTVVFLSDNGFNLGNHDSFHKMSQWDSAAHIPLGIWHAGHGGRAGGRPARLAPQPAQNHHATGGPAAAPRLGVGAVAPAADRPSFGTYDRNQCRPVTCVFGTLSVRPSVEGLRHLRYFRYPNGEEHVYDIVADPGRDREPRRQRAHGRPARRTGQRRAGAWPRPARRTKTRPMGSTR